MVGLSRRSSSASSCHRHRGRAARRAGRSAPAAATASTTLSVSNSPSSPSPATSPRPPATSSSTSPTAARSSTTSLSSTRPRGRQPRRRCHRDARPRRARAGHLPGDLRDPRPRGQRDDHRTDDHRRCGRSSARCERRHAGRHGCGDGRMPGMDHSEMTAASEMDQMMIDSMAAFPAETEGVGNQLLDTDVLPDGTKHFELTAAVIDWEVDAGQDRQGLGLQRHGARPDDQPRRRRQGRGRSSQRAAGGHRHPLARHRRPQRPGRRRPDHPGRRSRPARPTPTSSPPTEPAIGMYHAHVHGEIVVPNGMFGSVPTSATSRSRPAAPITGVDDPGRRQARPGHPDGPQRRRRHRPHAQRQELPGHRPARRQPGRLGRGHLLQRGPAGAPDAPARVPAARVRQGRRSRSTSPTAPTRSSSPPASATPCCSTPPSPGTWVWHCHILNHVERTTACSAWSPRSSSTRPDSGPAVRAAAVTVVDCECRDLVAPSVRACRCLHTGGRHERTDRTPRCRQLRPRPGARRHRAGHVRRSGADPVPTRSPTATCTSATPRRSASTSASPRSSAASATCASTTPTPTPKTSSSSTAIIDDLALARLPDRASRCTPSRLLRAALRVGRACSSARAWPTSTTRTARPSRPSAAATASRASRARTATGRSRRTSTCSGGCAPASSPTGARVLRAKIDMQHENMQLRDPVMYRIRRRAPPPHRRRVGDLPDVRLGARPERRDRGRHALAVHARVRQPPGAVRLVPRAAAAAVRPAAPDRVRPTRADAHGHVQAQARARSSPTASSTAGTIRACRRCAGCAGAAIRPSAIRAFCSVHRRRPHQQPPLDRAARVVRPPQLNAHRAAPDGRAAAVRSW